MIMLPMSMSSAIALLILLNSILSQFVSGKTLKKMIGIVIAILSFIFAAM